MILLDTIHELRTWRRRAGRLLLVPTMGALHEGHARLVREARRMAGESARVAATIFVNPLQFGPNEDFDRYPRTLESDLRLCEEAGADLVFAPPVHEVYHPDRSIKITESSLSTVLCGASRPGHFDGVCTVVAKLFNLVQPDEALFGRKDYQQLAVIRRLVRDLDIPVIVHGVETVREPDGLAMSSRNRYLSPEERAQAPALQAALRKARDAWLAGERDVPRLLREIREHVAVNAPLCREDYVSIVDPGSLQPLARVEDHAVALLAFWFGKARLIDNLELRR